MIKLKEIFKAPDVSYAEYVGTESLSQKRNWSIHLVLI